MRSHFVDIKYIDIQKLKEKVEYMYVRTLKNIKEKYEEYGAKELRLTHEQFRDVEFMDYFVKWVMDIMSNITFKTSIGHNINCVVRTSFDLVFKYCIDLEVGAVKIEECEKFMDLQCKIFKDNNWCLLNLYTP